MTFDVLCLVADKNMDAAVEALLARPQALGVRSLSTKTIVHPRRDPGCFHESVELLRPYRALAKHAIIMLDLAWQGAPATSGAALEAMLEQTLVGAGLSGWARAVVIDPELEVWVFSDSPHVERALGWADRTPALRPALAAQGLWTADAAKPADPKAAMEWALRMAGRPRSSSIYRDLSATVSLQRCVDRSFLRLRGLLGEWFTA